MGRILNPLDRGYLNSDIGHAVEVDSISEWKTDEIKQEFNQTFPDKTFDGCKYTDPLCPKGRMFLLYEPKQKPNKLLCSEFEMAYLTAHENQMSDQIEDIKNQTVFMKEPEFKAFCKQRLANSAFQDSITLEQQRYNELIVKVSESLDKKIQEPN